jgi:hypothetical protein
MSVRPVFTRLLPVLALVALGACASESPTAPNRLAPTTPSADMCPGGYSLADGKC